MNNIFDHAIDQNCSSDMKTLFDPVIKDIIHLVQDQVDRARNRKGAQINVRQLVQPLQTLYATFAKSKYSA